jgi:uncharacterized protein YggT (Ycf19 family)
MRREPKGRPMSSTTVQEYEKRAQEAEQSRVPTYMRIGRGLVWALYALVLVIIGILLTAFFLRLFGASTDAAFTRWIYRSAESAMRPFRGMFPAQDLGENSVLDVSLLVGAMVYLGVAIAVDALFNRLDRGLRRREAEIAYARAQADTARLQYEIAIAAANTANTAATATPAPVAPTAPLVPPAPPVL